MLACQPTAIIQPCNTPPSLFHCVTRVIYDLTQCFSVSHTHSLSTNGSLVLPPDHMMSLASHESTAPTPHTLTTLTMSSLPPQNASPPLGFLNAEESTKMTLANLAPSPETNEQGFTHPYNGGPNHVPSPPSDSQELDTLQQRSA